MIRVIWRVLRRNQIPHHGSNAATANQWRQTKDNIQYG
jgi:hypothetical protein